jgi:hypothetical protein
MSMRKILTIALMPFTILTASAQNAAGSVFKQSHLIVTLRTNTAAQLSEPLTVEEKRGHPTEVVDVPMPLTNKSIESDANATVDSGQTTPGTTQTRHAPAYHNHHLRNLVIFGVVLMVGFACLAAAAK